MTTSLEWLADIAPVVYSANGADKRNRFIAIAQGEVKRSLFSSAETYSMAVAYYAAHLLALSNRDDNSRGALVSEKEGDLQRSYSGSRSTGNIETNTTQYLDSYNKLLTNRVPNFYMQDGSKSY